MTGTPSTVAPSRRRAIFFFTVIFLAGAIVGSALTIGIGRRVIQRANNAAMWNVDAMRRLDRHLELTPEQRARLRPILVDMARRLRQQRVESRRVWTDILGETRDKVRAELTPEQQAEFDRLATRTRDNLGRFLGAPPEPGTRRLQAPPAAPTDASPRAPESETTPGSGL